MYLVSTTNISPDEVSQNSPAKTFSIGYSSSRGGFGGLIFEDPMDTPRDFKRSEIEDILGLRPDPADALQKSDELKTLRIEVA